METNIKKSKTDDLFFYLFMGTIILGFVGGLGYLVLSYFSM